MNVITLRMFIDMLNSLPDKVKDKKFGYLDLSHMEEADLENLKKNLIESTDNYIEECEN
jgi:hypothetical protein